MLRLWAEKADAWEQGGGSRPGHTARSGEGLRREGRGRGWTAGGVEEDACDGWPAAALTVMASWRWWWRTWIRHSRARSDSRSGLGMELVDDGATASAMTSAMGGRRRRVGWSGDGWHRRRGRGRAGGVRPVSLWPDPVSLSLSLSLPWPGVGSASSSSLSVAAPRVGRVRNRRVRQQPVVCEVAADEA